MDKIKIAMAHRGAGVAPVFAALEGGYFRENGLEPELVFYHGHPNSLKAVIAGEAQFTNAVGAELLLANNRHGGDAVVLASAISRSAQQVAARPGIKTREDLRGKRWGVTFRNDADECAMITAFDRWGWSIERDVEIVVVGNDGARLDLLLDQSKVDVAIMHAPETFQAPKRGYHIVEDFGRLDVSFQNSCAASTRSYMKNHPDIGLRYVKSFCQAVHRFRSDAAFGIHVLRKYSGETDMDVLRPTWVLFARYMGDMMFPSLEGVRNASAILHRVGALPGLVPPEDAVDLGPVATLEAQGFFDTLLGARDLTGEKRGLIRRIVVENGNSCMADVALRNVVKRYGSYEAVRGISLEIPDTKFVALVGPSGCGKTTTLRMIAGLEDLTAGEISIGGRVINDVAPKNRDIAMVFQSYALYPHMTVAQNMSFGLKLRGMAKSEVKRRVEEAARILDIGELLNRRPGALSGGQRQRVAMGRAIVRNPKVFLFDEPLSNLDAKLRVQMRTEIKRIHQQVKTTTIYVTHDQIEAMTLADYIVVMNRGCIEQMGTPHELYHAPKTRFVAGFMGSPAMNFIPCTLEQNASALSVRLGDGVSFPVPENRLQRYRPVAGKSLIFGLRPEHITEPRGETRGTFSEFTTVADVVEPMGTEAMIFFNLGGVAVSGRVDSSTSVPVAGEKLRLVANMAHMHLIDPESGAVV